jgi:hypothetical protein
VSAELGCVRKYSGCMIKILPCFLLNLDRFISPAVQNQLVMLENKTPTFGLN